MASDSDEDPTTPYFQEGVDYTVGASGFAVITEPGSGYNEAPAVILSGEGGGEATVTLSAGVRRVTMTAGASGYRNQPLELILSGGGGSRAEGVITVDGGGGVGITMAEGGSGDTSPPTIEFPLPLNNGSPATGTVVPWLAAS